MSYLNRDEPRSDPATAMRALADGFAAMTVRRIASEADNAPPAECITTSARRASSKRWPLSISIRTLLDAGRVPPPATGDARLHAMLGSGRNDFEPYINCGERGANSGR